MKVSGGMHCRMTKSNPLIAYIWVSSENVVSVLDVLPIDVVS